MEEFQRRYKQSPKIRSLCFFDLKFENDNTVKQSQVQITNVNWIETAWTIGISY